MSTETWNDWTFINRCETVLWKGQKPQYCIQDGCLKAWLLTKTFNLTFNYWKKSQLTSKSKHAHGLGFVFGILQFSFTYIHNSQLPSLVYNSVWKTLAAQASFSKTNSWLPTISAVCWVIRCSWSWLHTLRSNTSRCRECAGGGRHLIVVCIPWSAGRSTWRRYPSSLCYSGAIRCCIAWGIKKNMVKTTPVQHKISQDTCTHTRTHTHITLRSKIYDMVQINKLSAQKYSDQNSNRKS